MEAVYSSETSGNLYHIASNLTQLLVFNIRLAEKKITCLLSHTVDAEY
jgi:hypothetical protein